MLLFTFRERNFLIKMETKITEDNFIEYMAADFPSFKVTKCNLTYPTSDFVTSFYSLIIEAMTSNNTTGQLWDLTEEQLARIEANQSEGSAFVNHIWSRNLHAVVQYIFSQVNPNVPEFSYSDILLPENTPRRTFVFMSFMLNCFYYFISFSEGLHDDMIACEEKGKEIQNKRDLKAKLLNEVAEFENQKKDRVEWLKNIKASILKYTTSNNEKENILKELHTKESSIMADLKKLEEKEASYQEELIRLENSISHFQTLIVTNPDEAAEIHASSETKKIECKEKMENLEKQVKVSSDRLTRFNKVIELQQILNNVIMKHDDSSDDLHKDFKELENNINNLNGKLINLKTAESKYSAQLLEKESLIPKLKNACSQLELEESAMLRSIEERSRKHKEYIEKQEKLYTQMSIKMRKEGEEIGDINSRIEELSLKCADLEQQIRTIDNETKEKYWKCNNEVKAALDFVQNALASNWSGMGPE